MALRRVLNARPPAVCRIRVASGGSLRVASHRRVSVPAAAYDPTVGHRDRVPLIHDADDEFDFVLPPPEAAEAPRPAEAADGAAEALGALLAADAAGLPLGVVRDDGRALGRTSRFDLPLTMKPAAGPFASRDPDSPTTEVERAAIEAQEEHSAALAAVGAHWQPMPGQGTTDGDAGDDGGGGGGGDPTAALPYDSPHMAERVLEMEVAGQLDECWQDAAPARPEDVAELVAILRDMKVRDVAVVNVAAKTSAFDFLVFGTCEGPRHMHLAAWAVQDADKLNTAVKQPRRKSDELWECVPIGRIVVNLMAEEYRAEVCAERKWLVTSSMNPLDAARAPVSEGRQVSVHGLWTLTVNLQDLEDFEVDYCKDTLVGQL